MKCPICGKEVELLMKKVGTDENGAPVLNEYAICRDCKKQWNLDKQRAKKMAARGAAASGAKASAEASDKAAAKAKTSAGKTANEKTGVKQSPEKKTDVKGSDMRETTAGNTTADKASAKEASVKDSSAKKASVKEASVKEPAKMEAAIEKTSDKQAAKKTEDSRPAKKKVSPRKDDSSTEKRASSGEAKQKTAVRRKKPGKPSGASEEEVSPSQEQKYGNIPSEKVRSKSEKAVRKNYEDMLAADPDRKPVRKKKKKVEADPVAEDAKESLSKKASPEDAKKPSPKKKAVPAPVHTEEEADDYDFEDDVFEETPVRFKPMRILLGILSIAGFAFFLYEAFINGLSGISSGNDSTVGTIYIILAIGMLLSAIIYFVMMNKATIFAFLVPMVFYLASGIVGFLNRGDDFLLLIAVIINAALALISLILGLSSRGGDEDEDDFDDAFEDDFDN